MRVRRRWRRHRRSEEERRGLRLARWKTRSSVGLHRRGHPQFRGSRLLELSHPAGAEKASVSGIGLEGKISKIVSCFRHVIGAEVDATPRAGAGPGRAGVSSVASWATFGMPAG